MNLPDIAEATGWFALHARYAAGATPIDDAWLHDYVTLSKLRHREWMAAISGWDGGRAALPDGALRRSSLVLAEEILAIELLARVVAALLAEWDSRRAGLPAARRVLFDVLDARRRVLHKLLGEARPLGALFRINQVRRRLERWTDVLMGACFRTAHPAEFCIDSGRFAEHRAGEREFERLAERRLLLAGLRRAVTDVEIIDPRRFRLHRSLFQLVSQLYPEEILQLRQLELLPEVRGLCAGNDGAGRIDQDFASPFSFVVTRRVVRPLGEDGDFTR